MTVGEFDTAVTVDEFDTMMKEVNELHREKEQNALDGDDTDDWDQIEQHLRSDLTRRDPATREKIFNYVLIKNRALKSRIDEYKVKRKEWRRQQGMDSSSEDDVVWRDKLLLGLKDGFPDGWTPEEMRFILLASDKDELYNNHPAAAAALVAELALASNCPLEKGLCGAPVSPCDLLSPLAAVRGRPAATHYSYSPRWELARLGSEERVYRSDILLPTSIWALGRGAGPGAHPRARGRRRRPTPADAADVDAPILPCRRYSTASLQV